MASRKQIASARLLYWGIAVLLAAILLYFSLRGIAWPRVWLTLSRAKANYVALWIVLNSTSMFLRALRWRILLRSAAPVTIATAFWATAAGYFGNNYLPARAGELIRTVMVSFHSGLTKTFVLTTALSERLCDGVALVLISSVVLLALSSPPGWFAQAAKPFAILGLCGVAAIAITPRLEALWAFLLERVPLPHAISERARHAIQQILNGMRAFHQPFRLLSFFLLTLVIWVADVAGAVLLARGLDLSLALPVAFLLMAGLGLASALPATPGYVGIYQFVAVSVLTPFGFDQDDSIAYILLLQALQYVAITIWGLLAFVQSRRMGLRDSMKIAAFAGPTAEEASPRVPSKL